ncbi:hypothetical protein BH18CHL2_BH18CHL2_10780 [soil metagenome]
MRLSAVVVVAAAFAGGCAASAAPAKVDSTPGVQQTHFRSETGKGPTPGTATDTDPIRTGSHLMLSWAHRVPVRAIRRRLRGRPANGRARDDEATSVLSVIAFAAAFTR